jgi:hypothetical protein
MNDAVPPLIHCARVLYYAIVDDSVRYAPKGKIFVGDVELGAVPRLAIVRNLVDDGIMLLHCDEEWASLGVSGSGSVEDVMAHANRRYEGLEGKWCKALYSDAAFAKAVADQYRDHGCSFCGRYHFQIDAMVVEGDRAAICGDCIQRLHAALAGESEQPT